jgi:superfamily II DNA or RNA helicase
MADDTSASTYLGQKGYSIFKECISVQEQQHIRELLTVRPFVPKAPVQPAAFPIYRESPNKLYVPRYFGVETYGEPDESRIGTGEPIFIDFQGELRDYQVHITERYLTSVDSVRGGGLLEIPCGRGKTVMALKIIAELGRKTLIIVHKGFLLNQWKERIEQFLPQARVGTIQGQVVDIEDKDIVIGMLQSLSMKVYPAELFTSFGLTVVDECHHISSEVFCRSLQTIVTAYTLGLSATMDRKDGLTKVFKMFLGEILYKEKRDTEDDVLVRAIEYSTSDDEYNETKYDWRGSPQISTMVSKICQYSHRTEFILEVLKKELAEKAGQQVMILAQQKNILVYLHKAIEHRKIASVGFYVGGMKESDLKKSESCTVILATYAMAAEALDIKTLTTLLLATPRTDVTQAVGRILRVKHERPLIIDIIDSHEVFRRQWKKRFTYYKTNKYKIMKSDNSLYKNNEWELLFDKTMKRSRKETTKDGIPQGVCLINV